MEERPAYMEAWARDNCLVGSEEFGVWRWVRKAEQVRLQDWEWFCLQWAGRKSDTALPAMLNSLSFPPSCIILEDVPEPQKVMQGALAIRRVPFPPLTALEAVCPELIFHPSIRPWGLPLQVPSWNLPSLYFCPRRPWKTLERGLPLLQHTLFSHTQYWQEGRSLHGVCESTMVPNSLLSVLVF